MYMHALYFAYVTTSHIGVGDVTAVTILERIYATIIMLISVFTTIYFFGNLASMVNELAPLLKIKMQANYRYVIDAINSANLNNYLPKVEVIIIFDQF
jgi:hypothetical protein